MTARLLNLVQGPVVFAAAVIRRVPLLIREPFRHEDQPRGPRPFFPELLRRLALPVCLGWLALLVVLNLVVPQPEKIVETHSGALVPPDFASAVALRKMGEQFQESKTNTLAFILLESQSGLGPRDRDYYVRLLRDITAEREVESVIDVWADPGTAAATQSSDNKAAYGILRLAGDMGSSQASASIDKVRATVAGHPAPPGTAVFVTGPSVVAADELRSVDSDMFFLALVTGALIFLLLLFVYRDLFAALLPLISVGLALGVSRPVFAYLGEHGYLPVSMFANAMLAALILGACTDYSVFFLGRYHEARRAGRSFIDAYHDSYRSVAHVVIASGCTVAGATACLSFTQLSMLNTSGLPCAIGILIGVLTSITATPALIEIYRLLGLLEPKSEKMATAWRRLGVRVVRWPRHAFALAAVVLLVCCLGFIGARVGYDERAAQPSTNPANLGYQAADRHFPKNRLSPDFVLITADHDLRNPTDLVALDRAAAKISAVRDVDYIQAPTRPLGKKLTQASFAYHAGYIGDRIALNSALGTKDMDSVFEQILSVLDHVNGSLAQIDDSIGATLARIKQLGDREGRVKSDGDALLGQSQQVLGQLDKLRGSVETLEGFAEQIAPVRAMTESNPNCDNERLCQLVKTAIDGADGVSGLSPSIGDFVGGIRQLITGITPAFSDVRGAAVDMSALAQTFGALKANVSQARGLIALATGLARVLVPQLEDITAYLQEIGKYAAGDSDDGPFYLPSQAFQDDRFQKTLKMLVSPDGKSARIIVYGRSESFSAAGGERAKAARAAADDALRGTELEGAVVMIGGVGSTMADIQEVAQRDFALIAVAALALVFSVVLLLLRSVVAAAIVIATVLFSYSAAIGLATFFWQHLLHKDIHWGCEQIGFAALVAVGADYNLLFTARLKEELGSGPRIGMIRTFAGTGGVVSTAGVIFGITMFAMLTSDITTIAQIGSIIGVGVLLDTMLVRSLLLPAAARLLGDRFWWPHRPATPNKAAAKA